jgi:hypothetical protein
VFPSLLSRLLEKNYSACIRSGFEGTGLYPVNVERATSKLLRVKLLRMLNSMRNNQPANKHAQRPKQKDKLPGEASYLHLLGISGQGSCVTASATNCRRPSKKAVRSPAFGYVSDSESGGDVLAQYLRV